MKSSPETAERTIYDPNALKIVLQWLSDFSCADWTRAVVEKSTNRLQKWRGVVEQ